MIKKDVLKSINDLEMRMHVFVEMENDLDRCSNEFAKPHVS